MLSAGEPCTHIKFVISGHVRLTICNESDRVKVSQTLSSPAVISPDFLFGRNTLYPASATAIDTVSIMQIEKKDFIPLLQSDDVFLFNYLNILLFIVSADIVSFKQPSLLLYHINGFGMIIHIQPVAHILAVAVYRKLPAVQRIVDNERN